MIARLLRLLFCAALPLALAACGGGAADENRYSLDDELAEGANGADPLLAAAVQDPLMTDPQLSTKSNADAIRPPGQPYAAPIPATDIVGGDDTDDGALTKAPAATGNACAECATARDAITLGALAARQADPRMRRCAPGLRYAAGWADRLPADVPLYRDARVIEAAGADGSGCRVRAVTFATRRPVDHMLDWYFTQATKAGYATERQGDDDEQVLVGIRRRDGGAYTVFVREAPNGGSEIDLLVNDGR